MPSLPNEASIVRLVGAVLLEANDEWQLQHRYLSTEASASVNTVDEEIDRFALAPVDVTRSDQPSGRDLLISEALRLTPGGAGA